MGCVGQVGALGPGGEAGGSGLFMLLSRGVRVGHVRAPRRRGAGCRALGESRAVFAPCLLAQPGPHRVALGAFLPLSGLVSSSVRQEWRPSTFRGAGKDPVPSPCG